MQGLIGFDRWSGDGAFVFEPGGGVEYPLTGKINFRATGAIHIGIWDGDASTGFRAGFGISMPLSGK